MGGINELKEWNSIYGISKTLSRNLIVGMLSVSLASNVWLLYRVAHCNDERIKDAKETSIRIQREKDVQDSLNMVFFTKYYQLKEKVNDKK